MNTHDDRARCQESETLRDVLDSAVSQLAHFFCGGQPSRLQSVITWIPCSERLPTPFTDVLAVHRDHDPYSGEVWQPQIVVAIYDGEKRWSTTYGDIGISRVSHWAELPELPVIKDDPCHTEVTES